MAEFVIAVVPLLMTFFGFLQVSKLFTASLAVRHSAIVAVRAAAVYSNRSENNPGATGDGRQQAKQAAAAALAPWIAEGTITSVDATVDDRSSTSDPYGPVQVQVTATYRCRVPAIGRFVCGGGTKVIRTEQMTGFSAQMPHQGAKYKVSE